MKTPMNEPITMFKKTIQLSQHGSAPLSKFRFFILCDFPINGKLSNSVRCFALWHFYTLLNHTCNIRNGIGAVVLEPF